MARWRVASGGLGSSFTGGQAQECSEDGYCTRCPVPASVAVFCIAPACGRWLGPSSSSLSTHKLWLVQTAPKRKILCLGPCLAPPTSPRRELNTTTPQLWPTSRTEQTLHHVFCLRGHAIVCCCPPKRLVASQLAAMASDGVVVNRWLALQPWFTFHRPTHCACSQPACLRLITPPRVRACRKEPPPRHLDARSAQ